MCGVLNCVKGSKWISVLAVGLILVESVLGRQLDYVDGFWRLLKEFVLVADVTENDIYLFKH